MRMTSHDPGATGAVLMNPHMLAVLAVAPALLRVSAQEANPEIGTCNKRRANVDIKQLNTLRSQFSCHGLVKTFPGCNIFSL